MRQTTASKHRSDDELGKVAQRRRPELAALDAAIDEGLERLTALGDDVVVVEFRELGMLVALGDEQARDQHAAGQTSSWMKERNGPLRKASHDKSVVSMRSRMASKSGVMTLRMTALNSSSLVLK